MVLVSEVKLDGNSRLVDTAVQSLSEHWLSVQTPVSTDPSSWLPFWRLSALLLAQIGLWSQKTWEKWPDVLIDFGREWSVPARMAGGELLYRDIAYFNGPLSPTVNALIFSVAEPNLASLWAANLFILAAYSIALMWLLSQVSSLNTACFAVSVFLALCGFQQYLPVGNYNWIAPYSHEMTHGLLLSVLSLIAADWFLRTRSWKALGLSGLLFGLVMLTKCELAIALFGGVGVIAGMACWDDWRRGQGRRSARAIGSFAVGVILPGLIAWSWTAGTLPASEALFAVLGSWTHLFNRELTNSPFYREVMGTANWKESLASIFGWIVIQGVVLGVAAWWGRSSLSPERDRRRAVLLLLGLLIVLATLGPFLDWLSMPRPWPVLLAALIVLTGRQLLHNRPKTEDSQGPDADVQKVWRRTVLRLGLLVWAGLLLLKILLFCRIFHYGFALAAPALTLVICAGWDWWPAWLTTRGRSRSAARAGVLALVVAGLFSHLKVASDRLELRTISVGNGPNRILAGPRGKLVNSLLADIEQLVPANHSLLCLPEGAMVNMFSGRRNPSRYLNFVPADMQMFGESRMLDDLRAHPPDWIAFINRDTSEYGPAVFGIDYARDIRDWMIEHYEVRQQTGHDMTSTEPGYTLLERRTDP